MKAYQKPQLFYEKFELSQHIASCDLVLTSQLGYGSGCHADGNIGGITPVEGLFLRDDSSCHTTIKSFESYCYTNSTAIVGTYMS